MTAHRLPPTYEHDSIYNSISTIDTSLPHKVDTPRLCQQTIAQKVAVTLTTLIQDNDKSFNPSCLKKDVGRLAGLFYSKSCDIPLSQYLKHLEKHAPEISPSVYILALVYIVRFCQRSQMNQKTNVTVPMFINSYNMHRIVLVAIILAHKILDDACYRNSYLAKVGGISKEELNRLEAAFLTEINFDLFVDPKVFASYADAIGKRSYKKICNQQIFMNFDE